MRKIFVLFICTVLIAGCNFGKREDRGNKYLNNLYYVKYYENQFFIREKEKKTTIKIPDMKIIDDFKISPGGNNILLGGIEEKENANGRGKIYLLKEEKELIKLSDDYLSAFPKWSNDGKLIAYMPFKGDDPSTGTGISITDLGGHKTNISGDKIIPKPLYEWLNDSDLIYYGMDVGKRNFKNIYRYNVKEKKEYIIYNNISGYCDFMTINNEGNKLLLVEGNGLSKTLKLTDLDLKKDKKINLVFHEFFGGKFSPDSKYAAIIASQSEEDQPHLFIYDLDRDTSYMATIDFPSKISTRTDYICWNGNKIYFMGESNVESVYSLDLNTKEIRLETEDSSKCFLPQFITK